MKSQPIRFIPTFFKQGFQKAYFFLLDLLDLIKGKKDLIPPRTMNFVGDGDFVKTGEEFKNYFIKLAHLKPTDKILDVGSGIGRMAIPLTSYLSQDGEYKGFDIVSKGVKWCQNNITPKFNNFQFIHSNVYNKTYNPKGVILAKDFKFGFADAYFDFVFLTSVFTHMLPSDVENYLSEISRVLKPGGRCAITFFIVNDESEKLIQSGNSSLDFKFKMEEGCLTPYESFPEAAIAYQENFVLKLFEKYNLKIDSPIHYGHWCKRDQFLTYQDLIIAQKIVN